MLQIDEVDKEILRIVQENSRHSTKEIGKRIGSPISTVYSRVKRLEGSGVIKARKALLDADKLGMGTTAFILASFTPASGVIQQDVAKRIARFPYVQEVHIIAGEWDILIKVKVGDVRSVGDFVVSKLREVKGIERTFTCVVFSSIKETSDIFLG